MISVENPNASVTIPGYMSNSPPAIIKILSTTFIDVNMKPLMPADTPKIPASDVMMISIT